MFIELQNNGQEIISTNYFDTTHAQRGYFYLSSNAGAFRLLVPDGQIPVIEECKTATEVIISRGPWPEQGRQDAIEILFEDRSDSPYAIHLSSEQVDRLPLDQDQDIRGQPPRWRFAAWARAGKALELPCRYRRVKEIPCLRKWQQ